MIMLKNCDRNMKSIKRSDETYNFFFFAIYNFKILTKSLKDKLKVIFTKK